MDLSINILRSSIRSHLFCSYFCYGGSWESLYLNPSYFTSATSPLPTGDQVGARPGRVLCKQTHGLDGVVDKILKMPFDLFRAFSIPAQTSQYLSPNSLKEFEEIADSVASPAQATKVIPIFPVDEGQMRKLFLDDLF